jgi:DNA-binding CsgD family transcriptional regulator
MDPIVDLINRRSLPGTLVFDHQNRLLFFNREALCLLKGSRPPTQDRLPLAEVPKEIRKLCRQLKKEACSAHDPFDGPMTALLTNESGVPFAARAFLVGDGKVRKGNSHIMVLLEKVGGKRAFNLESLSREYHLTRREIEVIRLICDGAANKEIAHKMKISEFTVRDHIKNILFKMDLHTRNEVVAFLINQSV